MSPRTHRAGSHTVGGVAGITGFVLALVGIGSLGDTPDPHDTAASTAAYFVEHRSDMFASTALVALASVAIIVFLAVLGSRIADPIAQRVAFTAGVGVVALLVFNELIYATLGFSIGRDDPSTAKSLFALTIVTPVLLSPFVALLLGTVAVRRGALPRWFAYLSAVGAVLVLPAMISFGDSGFLYPDVQQQIVSQVFLLWLLVGAIVIWRSQPATVVTL